MSQRMPNKERIARWVAALRSGSYAQGKSALEYFDPRIDDYRYCCLGVACRVALNDDSSLPVTARRRFQDGNTTYFFTHNDAVESTGYLPKPIAEYFGVSNLDPQIDTYGTLSLLNDILNLKFSEIADLIEKEYLTDDNANSE